SSTGSGARPRRWWRMRGRRSPRPVPPASRSSLRSGRCTRSSAPAERRPAEWSARAARVSLPGQSVPGQMAELVDALDLGSSGVTPVGVQFSLCPQALGRSIGRPSRPWPLCRSGPACFVALVEEETDMPKIIVNAFLTLDGVMQAPGGPEEDAEGGFPHGGWQGPLSGEDLGRLVTEGIADADGFLLGRKTYDIFSSYWPKITDPNNPIATALNSRPKYVVSRSLERVGWNNSRLIKGDVVAELRKLRQEPGRTVHTWGSTEVLQLLQKNDLIDEYRLFIYPVVLGSGKRLFGSGTVPRAFKNVESVPADKGATYYRLTPGGKPEYGTIGE